MPTTPLVSRRAALGGLAALVAGVASACSVQEVHQRPQRLPAVTRTSAPDDPDVALAAVVLDDEQAMLDQIVATTRKHPSLAGPVSGARAAHRRHVALLRDAVPGRGPSPSSEPTRNRKPLVPDRPGPALLALSRAESRLSLVVGHRAATVSSGPFARVLASMAAAASQQAVHFSSAGQASG